MSGVPRSQALISAHVPAAGNTPMFVCPQDTVTLVKSAYVYVAGATAADVTLWISVAGGYQAILFRQAAVGSGLFARWDGWVALNPSFGVFVNVTSGPCNVYVSGAVLMGAPQFPPVAQQLPAARASR